MRDVKEGEEGLIEKIEVLEVKSRSKNKNLSEIEILVKIKFGLFIARDLRIPNKMPH